jgi:chromosomal replication initiation ATPase DnaA
MKRVKKQFTRHQAEVLTRIADNPMFKDFKPLLLGEIHTPVSLQKIVAKVLDYYEISNVEFYSNRRERSLIDARKDFIHLAKKHTAHSNLVIGRCIGKDNSTVCYHLSKKSHYADRIIIE